MVWFRLRRERPATGQNAGSHRAVVCCPCLSSPSWNKAETPGASPSWEGREATEFFSWLSRPAFQGAGFTPPHMFHLAHSLPFGERGAREPGLGVSGPGVFPTNHVIWMGFL